MKPSFKYMLLEILELVLVFALSLAVLTIAACWSLLVDILTLAKELTVDTFRARWAANKLD